MVLPFVLAWMLRKKSPAIYLAGAALFALGTYAVMATVSRGAYLAYAVTVAVLLAGFAVQKAGAPSRTARRLGTMVLLCAIAGAVAVPIVTGPFSQQRLKQSERDFEVRYQHWMQAIADVGDDLPARLFGAGLGRFPETYYLGHLQYGRLASYQYKKESGNTYLRLSGGNPIYLEQRIALAPHTDYKLSAKVRGGSPGAGLSIAVCEKTLQHSYRCEWFDVGNDGVDGEWHRYQIQFSSGVVGDGPWHARRPVKIGLYNPRAGSIVDVDGLGLRDMAGNDLIANGEFSQGGDRWFFSSDRHLPWHIHNLALQVYFDQGWFGVIVLGVFVGYVFSRLLGRAGKGEHFAVILFASLSGFIMVGLFGSLMDTPRLTLMFFLIAFVGILGGRYQRPSISARVD